MASQDAKKDLETDRDIEVFKMVTSHFRQDLREFWNRANFYLLTNAGLFSAFLIIYPALIKDQLSTATSFYGLAPKRVQVLLTDCT